MLYTIKKIKETHSLHIKCFDSPEGKNVPSNKPNVRDFLERKEIFKINGPEEYNEFMRELNEELKFPRVYPSLTFLYYNLWEWFDWLQYNDDNQYEKVIDILKWGKVIGKIRLKTMEVLNVNENNLQSLKNDLNSNIPTSYLERMKGEDWLSISNRYDYAMFREALHREMGNNGIIIPPYETLLGLFPEYMIFVFKYNWKGGADIFAKKEKVWFFDLKTWKIHRDWKR